MSVEDYYNQLMGLFDDLMRLKPPHGCECGACSCDVAAKYAKDRDEEILHQFLVGIDDGKYSMVRTNLLSQQPPVTIEHAYHALLQEERSRIIAQAKAPVEKEDAHVFALPSSGQRHFQTVRVDKTKLYCSHCKRSGHDNAGCFILHGYPSWWLEKYGKKGGAAAGTTNSNKSMARANAVGSHVGGSPLPPHSTITALSELQPEHVRILLNMVNKHQQDRMTGEPSSLSWIVDTGASHHVTGDDSCLQDVHCINPCPVGLPDGAHAMAMKKGRVYLADDIIL